MQQQKVKLLTHNLNKELLEKDLTPWLDEPARKGGRTFILQGQNPLNKGKPLNWGCEILSTRCCPCRRVVQGVSSSAHTRACGNRVLPSKATQFERGLMIGGCDENKNRVTIRASLGE